MTEKILIFGASGRMGSNIIRSLPADLIEMSDAPPNVEFTYFDNIQLPEDLAPIFVDVKSMFLLWPPGTRAKTVMPPLVDAAKNTV